MSSGAAWATVEAETAADELMVCANCGIAQVDDIKLEGCAGCQLVSYCSDKCQEEHQEQHEEECKRIAAELHDRELFEQPDDCHLGECPLYFLPMPIDLKQSSFYSCCCKTICTGCVYANLKSCGSRNCPFCREPVVDEEEDEKRLMKRMGVNDPAAFRQMGVRHDVDGDYDKAAEYRIKAAELGDLIAHYNIGCMYEEGEGVEKDLEKAMYHWEKAAIGGHPGARYNLGCVEEDNYGNIERSVKHLIIAANLGDEKSMKDLWTHYSRGNITKEDLDATLRSHHAAVDATKSLQREEAEAFFIQR